MFEDHTKIQAFIKGELQGDELKNFEAAMAKDRSLRAVVENYKIYSAIADEIIDEEISELIKKEQRENEDVFQLKNNILKFLVGFVILFGLLYLLLAENKDRGERIYAELYSPPMGNTIRGEQERQNENATTKSCFLAHQRLDDGDFEEAIKLFNDSTTDDDLLCKEKSFYYLALILVKQNEFDKAKEYLNVVLTGGDSGYEDKARQLLELIQ